MRRAVALVLLCLIAALAAPAVAQSPAPSTPTSPPRPTPGTDASPTGLGWMPVSLEVPDGHWLTDLTPWAGGFAALESDNDDDKYALWTSSDGSTWDRGPLPQGVDNGRLVALGEHVYLQEFRGRGESQELRIRTWRTSDGRRWQDQGLFVWHLPASVGDAWHIVSRDVVAAPDRLVMFGTIEPCCGSGGSVPLGTKYASIATTSGREHVPLAGLAIWTSPDGAEWTRRSNRGLRDPETGDNAWLAHVAGVADGVLATSATADTLWASPDGGSWGSMGSLPPGYRGSLGSYGLVTVDGRVIVSFDVEGRDNAIEVWLRDADGEWTRSLRESWTSLSSLVASGRLVIAAGRSRSGLESWPRILVSADGGASWDPDLSWSGAPDGCARDLATDATRLVLFGCDDGPDTILEPGAPTLWHANVPLTRRGRP
jgi:hypothetical protein